MQRCSNEAKQLGHKWLLHRRIDHGHKEQIARGANASTVEWLSGIAQNRTQEIDRSKAEEELHNCHVPGHNDAYQPANVNGTKHYCLLDIGSAIT